MIRQFLYSSVTVASFINAQASDDFLNFKNNDTLHGSFAGYTQSGKLIWKNDQAEDLINFETSKIRRLIFNQGKLQKPFTHSSNITLINGDVVPCEVLAISEAEISIRTDFAGNLTIPRKKVRSLDLHPNGQKALYQGPYNTENWSAKNFKSIQQEEDTPLAWQLANFTLLYDNKKAGAIVNNSTKLPDAFQMSFDVTLSPYTNVSFAFHSDFKKPEIKNDDNKKPSSRISSNQSISATFGNTLVANIGTSSITLSSYSFDENGNTKYTTLLNTSGQRIARTSTQNEKSTIELRVNRIKKTISIYADKSLVSQWNLEEVGYPSQGSGFGFYALSTSRKIDKISAVSNLIISPWTSIKDSAVSLENEDRDIALLTNGTDRFSGAIKKLSNDKLALNSEYAELDIPFDEIKSINFATKKLDTWEPPKTDRIAYRFYGSGRLSATPISGTPDTIILNHPILGKISVDFKYLSSVDYTDELSILDTWLNN